MGFLLRTPHICLVSQGIGTCLHDSWQPQGSTSRRRADRSSQEGRAVQPPRIYATCNCTSKIVTPWSRKVWAEHHQTCGENSKLDNTVTIILANGRAWTDGDGPKTVWRLGTWEASAQCLRVLSLAQTLRSGKPLRHARG